VCTSSADPKRLSSFHNFVANSPYLNQVRKSPALESLIEEFMKAAREEFASRARSRSAVSCDIDPMNPMSVEQCVSEALSGLLKNRSRIVPGRLNRIMNALVPASLARKMEADLLGKGLASKSASAGPSSSLAGSTGS
jgi:hypothetical protein